LSAFHAGIKLGALRRHNFEYLILIKGNDGLKPSRCNFFIDMEGGGKLAFNSSSVYLAEIYADKYPIIQKLISRPDSAETEEEKRFLESLIEGQYLIDDELDEVEDLKARNRASRFNHAGFVLTIAPTLACNFKCDYCFEKQRPERMTDETIKALINFSETYIRRAENIAICWFGGEPTLCLSSIEKIYGEMGAKAAKYNAKFQPGTIVSNGYILDGKMAEKLIACGIHGGQITLDGPQRIHDRRRVLQNGKGTFRRIIENLKESSPAMKFVIRVNLDRRNYDMAFETLEALDKEGILPNVTVYFAPVNYTGSVCQDMMGLCLSTEEFSREQVELYKKLVENGFYQIEYPSLAAGGYCGADADSSFVIAPDGLIYKCWEEISVADDRSIGSIFTDETTPRQRANRLKYMAWDPFEKSECRQCEILPVCMGGCPHDGIANSNPVRGACVSWKYNLREMLTLRYICDLRKGAQNQQIETLTAEGGDLDAHYPEK
jgi:uncharacterized protein